MYLMKSFSVAFTYFFQTIGLRTSRLQTPACMLHVGLPSLKKTFTIFLSPINVCKATSTLLVG